MAQPKQKTTRRRTGNRRSHLLAKLQRAVNRTSPVKVVFGRKAAPKRPPAKKPAAAAKKPAAKKAASKKRTR